MPMVLIQHWLGPPSHKGLCTPMLISNFNIGTGLRHTMFVNCKNNSDEESYIKFVNLNLDHSKLYQT